MVKCDLFIQPHQASLPLQMSIDHINSFQFWPNRYVQNQDFMKIKEILSVLLSTEVQATRLLAAGFVQI